MKVEIITHSVCKRRELLLETFKKYLIDNGHDIVEDGELIVFYGCAFNTTNEKESRRMLRGMDKSIVHLGGVGNLLGYHEDFDKIFSVKTKWNDYKKNLNVNGILKIQVGEGCNDNCSYCGDKAIVGELKSYPIDYILNQIKGEYHTIELIGDDVGAWGMDKGTDFIELVNAVSEKTTSLIMQEVNIKYLIKYRDKLEVVLKTGKIKSIVLAFQSGNDKTLELMERGYTKKEVVNLVELLKKYGVSLRFHCIVGFPYETVDMFRDTLDILKMGFRAGSMFVFQPRHNTKAYDMDENKDVNECVKLVNWELIKQYIIKPQSDKIYFKVRK